MTHRPTPGPWRVAHANSCVAVIPESRLREKGEIERGDGRNVHRHGFAYDRRARRWVLDEEAVANAHLIAAAPDMLEALENLENDDGAIPPHAWVMVQTALAKARGEEAA